MAKHKGHLGLGIVLFISFFVVLFLIFAPIFPKTPEGEAQNGLDYADRMFNRLSKGSSYFIPKLMQDSEKYNGTMFSGDLKFDKPEDAQKSVNVLTTAGVQTEISGVEVKVSGDLGRMLKAVLQDSDAMYHNEGTKVKALYGFEELDVLKSWHMALSKIDKAFKKEGKIAQAKIVADTTKKGLETAYNFYGIAPQKVKEKIGLMTGVLVFYVLYTMWWGFAIFYIFEGIGLSMKKAKVKKEV